MKSRTWIFTPVLGLVGLVLFGAGCSPSSPRFTAALELMPNSNPAVPLAAVVRFSTHQPVETTLRVTDGTQLGTDL